MAAPEWQAGQEEAWLAELQKPLIQTLMAPPSPEECAEAWKTYPSAASLLARWGLAYAEAPEFVQNDLTLTKTALLSHPGMIHCAPSALQESNAPELAWFRIKGVIDRIDAAQAFENKHLWAYMLDEAHIRHALEPLVERCIAEHPEAYRVLALTDHLRHRPYDFDTFVRMCKAVRRRTRLASDCTKSVAIMLASDPLFADQGPAARTAAAQAMLLVLSVSSKYAEYSVSLQEMQVLIGRVPADRWAPADTENTNGPDGPGELPSPSRGVDAQLLADATYLTIAQPKGEEQDGLSVAATCGGDRFERTASRSSFTLTRQNTAAGLTDVGGGASARPPRLPDNETGLCDERALKRHKKVSDDLNVAGKELMSRILASFEDNKAAFGINDESDAVIMHFANVFLEPFFSAINTLYESNEPPEFLCGLCPPSGGKDGEECGQSLEFNHGDVDAHECSAKASDTWGCWNEDNWVCYECSVERHSLTGCSKRLCPNYNQLGQCDKCRPSYAF